jgi:hypothetical protein
MRCAIGRALASTRAPSSNAKSLIASITSNTTGDLSGALPCRSLLPTR